MSSEESSRCQETYYTTGKFAVHVFSQGGDTVMKLLVYCTTEEQRMASTMLSAAPFNHTITQ